MKESNRDFGTLSVILFTSKYFLHRIHDNEVRESKNVNCLDDKLSRKHNRQSTICPHNEHSSKVQMQSMWVCNCSNRKFEIAFKISLCSKILLQVQSMWIYNCTQKQSEEPFEDAHWSKILQMQPMLLYLFGRESLHSLQSPQRLFFLGPSSFFIWWVT